MIINEPARSGLLTINGGSSSLKFALFRRRPAGAVDPLLKGKIDRIGRADAQERKRGQTKKGTFLNNEVSWMI